MTVHTLGEILAGVRNGLVAFALVGLMAGCGGSRDPTGNNVAVTAAGPTEAVLSGAPITFTMTVSNVGNNTAGDIKLVNSLGNFLALNEITCTASGAAVCPEAPSVVMTIPTLPVGGTLVFKVVATSNATQSGTVTNSMSATLADDVNRLDNSATATASITALSSNLVVSGSGPAGTVTGGGAAEFVMTVRNDGPDPASNIKITDSVGGNLTLTGITCTAIGGASCPTVGVTMSLDSMPAGSSLEFRVATTVSPGTSGTVVNTLSVSADNDRTREDNSFVATGTAYTAKAGVFVAGVGPGGTVAGGGPAVFTMTVNNAGPDIATDVKIIDTVGSNLTLTNVTCSATGGAVCPPSLGPVMTVAALPAGSVLTFDISTLVALGTNGAITNSLSTTPTNDPDRTDNTAVAVGTASTSRANLQVTGAPPSGQVAGGATATFVMTVTNTGPDAAQDLRLVDTVGSNLTLTGITCTSAGSASCPSTGPVMTLASLPVGGVLTFAVQARVSEGTNGAITNTLQASATNVFSGTGNSAVAVGQAFSAVNNLSVVGVGPTNVAAGTTASFTMTVSNNGPQAAVDIHLVNTVGGNLTLTNVTCVASGGAVCPPLGVVMDVPTLPVGGVLVFRVDAAVTLGTNGAIVNTLAASVTGGTRAEVSGVAVGSAYANNIGVAATAPTGPLPGGAAGSFSMIVSNSGPGAATNVTITDSASSNLSLDGSRIVCAGSFGAVCPPTLGTTMVAPTIPANGVLSFTVPVTVNAGANGTATNTMTASAAGDSRLTDNSASATVTVFSADLGVSQTGSASAPVGSAAVFTAVVNNPGPGPANNVTITQTLTGGSLSNVTCTPTLNCPSVLGPLMTLPTLAAGRSLTFTFEVPVTTSPASIVSTVVVAGEGDISTTNNTASVTTKAVDVRNGAYKAYVTDGRLYDLTIDFDAGTYLMAGTNSSVTRAFVFDGSGGYTVTGNQRFRVAQDLLVGAHDFGAGVLPYVAARSFVTSASSVGSVYNLATRNINNDGSGANTRAGSARVSGNVLQICQDDFQVVQAQFCSVGSLKSYVLTVSGDLFTGAETTSGQAYQFRVARSGASLVLLSAGPSTAGDSTLQFRIGLPDGAGLAGGRVNGPSVTRAGVSDWLTIVLTSSTYAALGATINDVAGLARTDSQQPFSMLAGNPTPDLGGAKVWVLQATPLVVVIGNVSGTPNVSGLIQIGVP